MGSVSDDGYRDWRSIELAIKEAAKKASREAGPDVRAATVDAQIRQARFDRFLSRVFAEGEASEWMLKGGMSMLARVPQARTTKDMDLAAERAGDLAEAEAALVRAVDVDLGDHLTFRLLSSTPTGLGENQPGVLTRRYVFSCIDTGGAFGGEREIDQVKVDIVVGPGPVGKPEIIEPANRLQLPRRLVTRPYRLYPRRAGSTGIHCGRGRGVRRPACRPGSERRHRRPGGGMDSRRRLDRS